MTILTDGRTPREDTPLRSHRLLLTIYLTQPTSSFLVLVGDLYPSISIRPQHVSKQRRNVSKRQRSINIHRLLVVERPNKPENPILDSFLFFEHFF